MPYSNEISNNGNGYEDLFQLVTNSPNKIRDAKQEADSQDLYIIDPGERNPDKIEEQWNHYMGMTKPFRRKADWITLNYFGLTNQQIYDFIYNRSVSRQAFSKPSVNHNIGDSYQNIDGTNTVTESYTQFLPPNQEVPDMMDLINSLESKNGGFDKLANEAKDYMDKTGYIILIPGAYADLNSLEHAFYAYNSMIIRHQYMADWKAVELFGIPNRALYISIRKYLVTQDKDGAIDSDVDPNAKLYIDEFGAISKYFKTVIREDDITTQELSDGLIKFKNAQVEPYDVFVSTSLANDIQNMFDGLTQNVPSANITYTDLPAYSPDELIDMGVYSGGDPEAPIQDDDIIAGEPFNERWFRAYRFFYNTGIYSEEYNSLNLERLQRLDKLYKLHPNNFEESVYQLGWNPNAEYSPRNRVLVDTIMREHFKEISHSYDFINVSEDTDTVPEVYRESIEDDFKPIFIVLSSGKSAFSDLIKTMTDSEYSHAMLSLDSSLHKCFSYGVDTNVKIIGSFIIEDVPNKFKDALIRVYSVFVSNKIFDTIKTNVDWFIQNQKSTIYGWKNLITYLFNTPLERDHALICSQFVDKMLKLGHIDFTKKTSSLIAPSDLDKAAIKSKKIYQIYKGPANKWNQSRMIKKIKSIMARQRTYRWETPENILLREVKDAPVQIDKHGDVIIRSMKPTDFSAEFSKSHKLLMEYDKHNNTEGMKVELAKLWAYLLRIEELLYGNRSLSPSRRKELFSVRAMIIGDFKKYMEVVQRSEKDFDFSTYFDNSPYSNSSYKIHGSTVQGVLKLMKEIL